MKPRTIEDMLHARRLNDQAMACRSVACSSLIVGHRLIGIARW